MKVKSIVVGLADGLDGAMGKLDGLTEKLHASLIHSVVDTYYTREQCIAGLPGPYIVRVVVYEDYRGGGDGVG